MRIIDNEEEESYSNLKALSRSSRDTPEEEDLEALRDEIKLFDE